MDAAKTAYRAVTRQIEVTANPRFLPERSSPENGYFFWAYTITLTNLGGETVQLKTRHWRITDAQGRLQEVRGAGVVGEEPVLKPGENFEYTSGVPLPRPASNSTSIFRRFRSIPHSGNERSIEACEGGEEAAHRRDREGCAPCRLAARSFTHDDGVDSRTSSGSNV
jgi:ApaG protein